MTYNPCLQEIIHVHALIKIIRATEICTRQMKILNSPNLLFHAIATVQYLY